MLYNVHNESINTEQRKYIFTNHPLARIHTFTRSHPLLHMSMCSLLSFYTLVIGFFASLVDKFPSPLLLLLLLLLFRPKRFQTKALISKCTYMNGTNKRTFIMKKIKNDTPPKSRFFLSVSPRKYASWQKSFTSPIEQL